MGLKPRLYLAKLYLITDARQHRGDLQEFADQCFRGGVNIIRLRDVGLSAAEEKAALTTLRGVAYDYQGIVVVDHSPQIAGEFGADMLHLGNSDGAPRAARRLLHDYALIGQSTHNRQQIDVAVADGQIDYFTTGPASDLMRYAAKAAPPSDTRATPWFAVGGVNLDTIDDVLATSARRIMVNRAIADADDPQGAAEALTAKLNAAWDNDPAMVDFAGRVGDMYGV